MQEEDEVYALDADQIDGINKDVCETDGLEHALLDRDSLESAVGRPWAGHAEGEFYPTLLEKAAALLQAIASRQCFQDGNKRTAWVAATTFLELNGVDIGHVNKVHGDMFVRAAALDSTLEVPDLAEWFEATSRVHSPRPIPAVGRRGVGYETYQQVISLSRSMGDVMEMLEEDPTLEDVTNTDAYDNVKAMTAAFLETPELTAEFVVWVLSNVYVGFLRDLLGGSKLAEYLDYLQDSVVRGMAEDE